MPEIEVTTLLMSLSRAVWLSHLIFVGAFVGFALGSFVGTYNEKERKFEMNFVF